jgi:predicted SprT family Zn-dependent metalloprotease
MNANTDFVLALVLVCHPEGGGKFQREVAIHRQVPGNSHIEIKLGNGSTIDDEYLLHCQLQNHFGRIRKPTRTLRNPTSSCSSCSESGGVIL